MSTQNIPFHEEIRKTGNGVSIDHGFLVFLLL